MLTNVDLEQIWSTPCSSGEMGSPTAPARCYRLGEPAAILWPAREPVTRIRCVRRSLGGGSIRRARGDDPSENTDPGRVRGTNPACAGTTRRRRPRGSTGRDQPRACGDNWTIRPPAARTCGPASRERGRHFLTSDVTATADSSFHFVGMASKLDAAHAVTGRRTAT